MVWTPKPNLQSEGAEEANFNNVPDCQNYCISVAQCVAIDFDISSSPPCWIHTDSADLTVVIENNAVTQYLLNRACLGTGKICFLVSVFTMVFRIVVSFIGSTEALSVGFYYWQPVPQIRLISVTIPSKSSEFV